MADSLSSQTPTNAYPTGEWGASAPIVVAPSDRGGGGPPIDTVAPDDTGDDGEPAPDLPQIPGYKVLRSVGHGGMGTVFKAVQLGLNRVVALKLINSGWAADTEFRTRFDREVKALAALEHPNIVPVYDAGSWQGLSYLTMKFVPGKTLSHRLEVIRRDRHAAARLMVQVAQAVQFLHERGMVHRDLKPLNILLAADGAPLVADFGLIKPLADDSDLSITMIPLGTRAYMSPEQTRGGHANYMPACDIWALGVILYELLAGERPFAHEDPLELVARIRRDPVPPIDPNCDAPPELEAIARKCLEKAPADRYATAADLAADLERWLNGEEISTTVAPEPVAESAPAPAPVKRRRSRVLFVAAFAAVLGAAGAFREWRDDRLSSVLPEHVIPTGLHMTPLERYLAGQKIRLTDDKGKPTGEVPLPPESRLGLRTRDDYHEFFSARPAFTPLSEEEFPFPQRVTADLAITSGTEPGPILAVYVGRRSWPGAGAPYESMAWFGIHIGPPRAPAQPGQPGITQIGCKQELGWWKSGTLFREGEDYKETLWNSPKATVKDKRRFVPVEIVVNHDRIDGKIDGVEMKPVTKETMVRSLWLKARDFPDFGPAQPDAPFFGPGIGLVVSYSEGVFANVTVSKNDP